MDAFLERMHKLEPKATDEYLSFLEAEQRVNSRLLEQSGLARASQITLLAVSGTARGLGIGSVLLDAATSYVTSRGAKACTFTPTPIARGSFTSAAALSAPQCTGQIAKSAMCSPARCTCTEWISPPKIANRRLEGSLAPSLARDRYSEDKHTRNASAQERAPLSGALLFPMQPQPPVTSRRIASLNAEPPAP